MVFSAMSHQLTLDASGTTSALVYTCFLIGVSIMGLSGGAFLRAFTSRQIAVFSGISTAVLCLVGIGIQCMWTDMVLVGLVAFLGALSGPATIATFSGRLGANRTSGMAQYQSVSTAVSVGAPLLGTLLVSFGAYRWTLVLASLLHLASIVPWLMLNNSSPILNDRTAGFWGSMLAGYRCIFHIRALALMTVSRLLNNILYVGLPISLPLIIGEMTLTPPDAAWTQASGIAAMRTGAFFGGLILTYLLTWRSSLDRWLPLQAIACGFGAVVALYFAAVPTLVILACALAGLGQFAFRLSGTTFGPAVTPMNELAHTILAGDTIVRFFSSAYGVALLALIGASGNPALTLLCLSLFSLPAPMLMRPAIKIHSEERARKKG